MLSIAATYFQSFFKSHHFPKPKRVSFYLKHVIAINKDGLVFYVFLLGGKIFCWGPLCRASFFFWVGRLKNVNLGGFFRSFQGSMADLAHLSSGDSPYSQTASSFEWVSWGFDGHVTVTKTLTNGFSPGFSRAGLPCPKKNIASPVPRSCVCGP